MQNFMFMLASTADLIEVLCDAILWLDPNNADHGTAYSQVKYNM